MALDYPEKVERLMVLDIAPTLFAFENMTHKSVSLHPLSYFPIESARRLIVGIGQMALAPPESGDTTCRKSRVSLQGHANAGTR
jgi:hypothetical protein